MNKSYRSVCMILVGFIWSPLLFGQVKTVSNDFMNMKYANNVELRNSEGSETVSAEFASQQINSFIRKVHPQKVKTLHKGYSKDKSSFYGIVQLNTDSGNHRIFYYCENVNGNFQVTKVRINKR